MSTPKATGFMSFDRQTASERPAAERLNDWNEMYIHLPVIQLQEQGQRCMDCGIPFCHTGKVLNNMASGCPLNNLIPEWNDLVYRGLWREAYERLDKTNNFPEFTGRTCPAPCEAACVLGMSDPDDAVTIKSIENAIIDRAFDEGWVTPTIPAKRTGKRVAVVGSGPAGLACADQLNKVGHMVTVFERAPRPGGLMTYGIPNMKIEKTTVLRRIKLLEESGITFECNTEVGVNYPPERLKQEFDAIVLCGGATKANTLPVPGNDAQGIHLAVDFLSQTTESLIQSELKNAEYLSAAGKNVIVIGGGDTGTDCVGTSLRHGCKSVVQFEIVSRPPDSRAADNPWPQWPKTYKLDYGQKEAKHVYGADPREFEILTKEFIKDENGQLTGVRTVQIEWVEDGRGRRFEEVADSERVWPADIVLIAIGFRGPENPLLEQLEIERDTRSNAKAEFGNFKTNVDKIFAAGDMRRGQSLVVWAISEGRGAARECDRFLMGETDLP